MFDDTGCVVDQTDDELSGLRVPVGVGGWVIVELVVTTPGVPGAEEGVDVVSDDDDREEEEEGAEGVSVGDATTVPKPLDEDD